MKKQDLSARQAEALRGSIRKWEKIVDGTGFDYGGNNCHLCQLYATRALDCLGCPVRAETGKSGCFGTPYYKPHNERPMLDFLKSILDAAYVRQPKGAK